MCKFAEKRVSDNKCPLLLTFKDGNRDFRKDNLTLLCYNCMFLTTGVPVVAHKNHISNTLNNYNSGKEINTYTEKPQEKDLLKYEPKEEFEKAENIADIDIKSIQEEAMRELEEWPMIYNPDDFEELQKMVNHAFKTTPSIMYELFQGPFDITKYYESQGPEYYKEILDDYEDEN